MNTVFQIKANEFDESLFDWLKTFVSSRANAEIIISVRENSIPDRDETETDFFSRLDMSVEEINRGEGTLFTMDELKKFVKE